MLSRQEEDLDTLLHDIPRRDSRSIYNYFLPRATIVGAIESETAYLLLVNLLLPILLELQKGDVLTIRVYKGLDSRCKLG